MKTFRIALALTLVLAATFGALAADADDLTGTSWQLVNIRQKDGKVDIPEDASRYKLDFTDERKIAVQADCNRGGATWTAGNADSVRFQPIVSTRVLCPPTSLSDSYLARLEEVSSYTIKNGHLFLSTVADKTIIEFEPVSGTLAAATILGEDLYATNPEVMQEAILTRLFDQYATDHGIAAEASEIDSFLDAMQPGKAGDGLTAQDDLTPEETAEVVALEKTLAEEVIRQWQINKALYEQYGGRIVYQQFGPEPLDALRRFLEQHKDQGDFVIRDTLLDDAFWDYFTNESLHDFMAPGSDDEANAFSKPPWRQRP